MKSRRLTRIIAMTLFALAIPVAAWPQGPAKLPSSNPHRFVPPRPRRPTAPKPQLPGWHTGAARLPGTARNVILVTCPAEAQSYGAICGNIIVPLDWRRPNAGTIPINFEIYTHYAPGPALSAIFVNFGGPGPGTTPERGSALYLYGANLDTHDLVLVDNRGTGLSGTLVCNELQYGLAPWDQAVADCAAQLGPAASWYGTGDIANDIEAVRAALGYNWVDYHGGSLWWSRCFRLRNPFSRSLALRCPGRALWDTGGSRRGRVPAGEVPDRGGNARGDAGLSELRSLLC
jgi:hypothetical protein